MACPRAHDIGLEALEPRLFSFNAPWTNTSGAEYFAQLLEAVAAAAGFSTAAPWRQLPAPARKVVLHGFREQVHLTCPVPFRPRSGRGRARRTRGALGYRARTPRPSDLPHRRLSVRPTADTAARGTQAPPGGARDHRCRDDLPP
ncbi:hypothetical protein [Streptomyces mirabilis]